MKNLCTYCDRRFSLYNDFRRHLQTKHHKKKNTGIFTDVMLEQLDKNRKALLLLIHNSAPDI
jgi:hypothetical protein